MTAGAPIRVGAPGSAHARQTIFRGEIARSYRLFCDEGQLMISLDGQPADQLHRGQSMDIEARLIRVCAGTDAGATGRFVRLERGGTTR